MKTGEWDLIDVKPVKDWDGFYTDYAMWYSESQDKYIFIFGDSDVYTPENSDWDWECDSEDEANEWFNNYEGFDDDIDSATDIEAGYDTSKANKSKFKFNKIRVTEENPGKWYRFLSKIKDATGLEAKQESVSRPGAQWIYLFDEDGDLYEAEVTQYYNGSYELMGYNISYVGDV